MAPVTTADINNADEGVKDFYRVAEAWCARQVRGKEKTKGRAWMFSFTDICTNKIHERYVCAGETWRCRYRYGLRYVGDLHPLTVEILPGVQLQGWEASKGRSAFQLTGAAVAAEERGLGVWHRMPMEREVPSGRVARERTGQ